MEKMVIGMFSGGIDRLTGMGVISSGAAAFDMDLEIYVLLMAANAFKKENFESVSELSETPDRNDQFFAGLKKNKVKKWYEFLREAKDLTNVKINVCGLAGKIWDGEKKDDFIDLVDNICGIGEYIEAAKNADVHFFI